MSSHAVGDQVSLLQQCVQYPAFSAADECQPKGGRLYPHRRDIWHGRFHFQAEGWKYGKPKKPRAGEIRPVAHVRGNSVRLL